MQKSTWTFFLSTKVRCFGEVKQRATLNALPYCFSQHFLDKSANFLLAYNLRSITKEN